MTYTIDELRHKIFEDVYSVYEIFKDFFGEEFTDLQELPEYGDIEEMLMDYDIPINNLNYEVPDNVVSDIKNKYESVYYKILVYWPKVTVTNESNKSIIIRDLYAKITVNIYGTIPYEYTFQLNRSRYSIEQFLCNGRGYLHSHVVGIPKSDLSHFQTPCLGTGPINNTINSLHNDYDETLWMLFCQELSMYVTVESLSGGPYMKLEEVGLYVPHQSYTHFTSPPFENFQRDFYDFKNALSVSAVKDFIVYYLQNGHLNISFEYNQFVCGMSYFDFMIDISNAFIDFYNTNYATTAEAIERLYRDNIIEKVTVVEGKFCNDMASYDNNRDIEEFEGKYVCYFKGQDITLKIDRNQESDPVYTTLLRNKLAMHILERILRVINYRYRNEYNNFRNEPKGKPVAPTYQNVRYL